MNKQTLSFPEEGFKTFRDFYPYYLSEHGEPSCRRLHFVGTSLVIALLIYTVFTQRWALLWLVPLVGYGFAWVGHFFFEKNKPATFKAPLYSLWGDFVMWKDILVRRIDW